MEEQRATNTPNATGSQAVTPRSPDGGAAAAPREPASPIRLQHALPSPGTSSAAGLVPAAKDETSNAEAQTCVCVDAAVQCEPPRATAEELAAQAQDPQLAAFLLRAAPLCGEALQQNELLDVLADELAALAYEDGGEDAVGHASSRPQAAAGLVEHHSFSDLVLSKNKLVAWTQWHPSRRGVAGVACTYPPLPPGDDGAQAGPSVAAARPQPCMEDLSAAPTSMAEYLSRPPTGCILIWNQADGIQPEAVLQAPAEVLSFAFHPSQPHWVAAGLVTGQVALFNLQQPQQQPVGGAGLSEGLPSAGVAASQTPKAVAGNSPDPQGQTALTADCDGQRGARRAAALLPTHVSLPGASHEAGVTDLQWLPGLAVGRDGKLDSIASGSESNPDACTVFATTALDGSLLLWDMRITLRQRKAAVTEEEQIDWKPALGLAATSSTKQLLLATRLCADASHGPGSFALGGLEGDVAVVHASTVCSERKGATERTHNTVQQLPGHMGRICALACSPFFTDLLLAVGDSGFVLWRRAAAKGSTADGSAADAATRRRSAGAGADPPATANEGAWLPLYESPFSDALYTCGCWSPSKPGTIILGRHDGRLEVWDLLDRAYQAALVAPVAPCGITSLAVSQQPAASGRAPPQQLLAVGDSSGTLRVVELPRSLRRRGRTEMKAMLALLEEEEEVVALIAQRDAKRLEEEAAAAAAAKAEEEAALRAERRRQQEAQAAASAQPKEEAGQELSPEEKYLAYEAYWRAKLLGAGASAAEGCGA